MSTRIYYAIIAADNTIKKTIFCDSDRVSNYCEQGDIYKACSSSVTNVTHYYDGAEIKEKAQADWQPMAAKPWSEVVSTLFKQLKFYGTALPAHNEMSTKQDVKDMIDLSAGRARLRFVSDGVFTVDEYAQALKQAREYLEKCLLIFPLLPEIPPMVQTRIDVTGLDREGAAQSIVDAAAAWETALNEIFDIRLKGKKAVDDANAGTFAAVGQACIDELNAYPAS